MCWQIQNVIQLFPHWKYFQSTDWQPTSLHFDTNWEPKKCIWINLDVNCNQCLRKLFIRRIESFIVPFEFSWMTCNLWPKVKCINCTTIIVVPNGFMVLFSVMHVISSFDLHWILGIEKPAQLLIKIFWACKFMSNFIYFDWFQSTNILYTRKITSKSLQSRRIFPMYIYYEKQRSDPNQQLLRWKWTEFA